MTLKECDDVVTVFSLKSLSHRQGNFERPRLVATKDYEGYQSTHKDTYN